MQELDLSVCIADHEIHNLLHIRGLVHDELQLLDVSLIQHLGHHQHLGQLGFQINAVALGGYQLYLACAGIQYVKQAFYIVYILDLHSLRLLSSSLLSQHSYSISELLKFASGNCQKFNTKMVRNSEQGMGKKVVCRHFPM